MFQSSKQRIISRIIFSVYFILLVWLILFKFATSLSELPSIRGINLIPFYYEQETNIHSKEVLYNILVFIPLGIYIQVLRENWKIPVKGMVILLTSLLFEAVQFIFAIGASDITDLIGNTVGGVIGILFCVLMKKVIPKKFISLINSVGILMEAIVLVLLALLLVANR